MKRLATALGALAIATGLGAPAFADTTLNVHYPMPGFFKDVMADISAKFMEENPDIKINFVSPSATYEEGIQTIMRQAGTSEMRTSPSPASTACAFWPSAISAST